MFGNFDMSKMGEMLQVAQNEAKQMDKEGSNNTFVAHRGQSVKTVGLQGEVGVVVV